MGRKEAVFSKAVQTRPHGQPVGRGDHREPDKSLKAACHDDKQKVGPKAGLPLLLIHLSRCGQ